MVRRTQPSRRLIDALRPGRIVRGVALAVAACAAMSVAGCGLLGGGGTPTVVAVGDLHRDPDRAPAPLSIADRLLLDATAQGLVTFGADGQVEAGLAERWTVIDGGRSYIFRLREARWPDGKRVRAADVAEILRRRMMAARLRPALRGEFASVESVRAMTAKVIEIRLSRPEPYLLDLLAQPDVSIVNRGTGWGPWRVEWHGNVASLSEVPLMTMVGKGVEDDAAPEHVIRLIGSNSLDAVTRFDEGSASAVIGGRYEGWPYIAAADISRNAAAVDPTDGLFGLAVVNDEGPLASTAVRDAINMAIDRARIAEVLSARGWSPRITIRPSGSASGGIDPVYPDWVSLSPEQRLARARRQVALWREGHEGVTAQIRIALPEGPGSRILFAVIRTNLKAIGLDVRLVALSSDADLRLIDEVAPSSDPAWYLRRLDRAFASAGEGEARRRVAAIADASAAQIPDAIGAADRALTADTRFIPLGAPLRWSLVSTEVRGFRPNVRSRHGLNRLIPSPD